MSRDDTRYWLSRTLPAFGLGILGTFVVCRVGWWSSTPLQRGVFGLGVACVLAGLAVDLFRRAPSGETMEGESVADTAGEYEGVTWAEPAKSGPPPNAEGEDG